MKCRICDEDTEPFACISTADLDEPFLDESLRRELPQLKLRRCPQCSCLWADDVRQDEGILARAYERVSDAYFDSAENDQRYTRFYKRLEQLVAGHVAGTTVLDVGCGDGAFLSTLSDRWLKRGLEPTASGSGLARKKNLDVSCATLDSSARQYQANLISALDVIEHVIDPHHFVESFKRHLRPGGVVLLLTGDAIHIRHGLLAHNGRTCVGVDTSPCSHSRVCENCWTRMASKSSTGRAASILRVRARWRGGACTCWSLRGLLWDEANRGIHSGATIKR